MKIVSALAVAVLALSACGEGGKSVGAVSDACAALTEANGLIRHAIARNITDVQIDADIADQYEIVTKIVEDNDLSKDDMRRECNAEMDELEKLEDALDARIGG